MALYDIYSKRQKRLRGEVSDVYVYDKIPQALRQQIIFIVNDFVESYGYEEVTVNTIYYWPENTLCREYGIRSLNGKYRHDNAYEILGFIEITPETDKVLDAIELVFNAIDNEARAEYDNDGQPEDIISPDEAILELNTRFKEHGIGYAFEGGMLIRIDSTYTHAEIIKPTLALLAHPGFAGANDEYLTAHEHYRHGRNKECLTECLKAFESTMKTICAEKGWAFDPAKDAANKLIQICFANNLVPAFMQNHITALKNVLETGVPTVRNKLSGHGQGAVPREVDDDVARYALNLTGANIIFLVEQSGIV
jgi:hypothetical protein